MFGNLIMSIPSVLMNGVTNESQDLTINTEVLEPNSLNAVQAVFVLPKKGSVLDSKSALKFRIDWSGYTQATASDIGGKLFSGVPSALLIGLTTVSEQMQSATISLTSEASELQQIRTVWSHSSYWKSSFLC